MAGISAAVLATMVAGAAVAEEDADNEADAVIVTGTRTSGLKAVDSPAPVQVLGGDILKRTGQPELVQALAQNVPSFNAQAFGGDTANLTLSAKLRGLSPNHALVLLNGKRRHGTANLAVLGGPYQGGASADLNFIPLASVERVEVLLEGAAAQYGTDAIAGVINIIQKKNTEGGQLIVSGGHYFDEGGMTADLTGNIGFEPFEGAYLSLSGETKYHGFSFRGDVDPRVLNTAFNGASASRLANYPTLVNARNYPYMNRIAGDAQYRLTTVTYNFGYDITPEVAIYSFGSYGYKFAQAYENYRVPNLIVGKDGTRPRPNGFSPKESITENDYAFTAGIDGKLGGWRFDLSTTYGKDDDSVNVLDSLNRSLYIDTSTLTTPGFSPSDFHAGDFIGTQWTTTFDVSREFDLGLAGPLTLAAGVEYREETYEIKAGDAASRYKEGSQSYPGFSLTDAGKHGRDNKAIYVDLAVKPLEALQLDAAVRYEDFSDFGDTTVAKLTGRYDFSDAFGIRATASTGFRAPTLAEEYYSATNVSPTSAFVQLPPNSPAAALIGVTGLKPEKSTNYSVGFVAHPGDRLTMTLDFYQITIEDRIVGSGSLFGSGGSINSPAVIAAILANGNVLDPTVTQTGITIFTNGLDTRTKGADFLATYFSDFGEWGTVDWSLSGNYTTTKITKVAPAPPQLAPGVTLYDLTSRSNLETAAPKYRVTAAATWSVGDFTITLKEAFYGEASQYGSRTGCPVTTPVIATCYKSTIKAAALTDLDISYTLFDKVKFTVGANNLFNKYPNKLNPALRQDYFQANSNGYVPQYPTFSPFGINGGFYYGRVTWTF